MRSPYAARFTALFICYASSLQISIFDLIHRARHGTINKKPCRATFQRRKNNAEQKNYVLDGYACVAKNNRARGVMGCRCSICNHTRDMRTLKKILKTNRGFYPRYFFAINSRTQTRGNIRFNAPLFCVLRAFCCRS